LRLPRHGGRPAAVPLGCCARFAVVHLRIRHFECQYSVKAATVVNHGFSYCSDLNSEGLVVLRHALNCFLMKHSVRPGMKLLVVRRQPNQPGPSSWSIPERRGFGALFTRVAPENGRA